MTLPLLALLFVPVLGGVHELFHWTHHDAVQHDALLAANGRYAELFRIQAEGYQ